MVIETTITYVALLLVIVSQLIINQIDKKRALNHEKDLLNRLAARDLAEYAAYKRQLDLTPKDEKDLLKLENQLAVKAAEIAEKEVSKGIPVI